MESPQPSRRRRATVWSLVVVASLIGVLSVLATWVDRQVLDNQSWRNASDEIIRDENVRSALSTYLVDQLYANVDIGAELEQRLPKNAGALAGPISAALRQPATNAVDKLLVAPRIQQLWTDANGAAHQRLINVVENKTGFGISTGNGVVTVDLGKLVRQLGDELGLPAAALDKLPSDTGVITVMRSDQLSTAQLAVRVIRALDALLGVLVVILFGIALFVARGFRRATLRNIGWAFVIVGLVFLGFRRVAGGYVVDTLVAAPNRDAGDSVWATYTGILREIGRATIFYGVVAVLGAVLAGPTAAATAVRRWMAPVLNERPGIVWGVTGAAFLLLVLWGPTYELRNPVWILVLGALVALGVQALRRASGREFPDATFAGGQTASRRSVRQRVATVVRRPSGAGAGPQPTPLPPGDHSPAQEITRLGELRDAGLITDDEFARGKTRALA